MSVYEQGLTHTILELHFLTALPKPGAFKVIIICAVIADRNIIVYLYFLSVLMALNLFVF